MRALLPPTPMPGLDEAAGDLRLPPSVHDAAEHRRRRARLIAEHLRLPDDDPTSVVDIHLYEETARFHALLDAWAHSSLARTAPEYREVARALNAAMQR